MFSEKKKFRLVYEGRAGIDYAEFDLEREALVWAASLERSGRIKAIELVQYDRDQKTYVVVSDLSLAPIVANWEMDMVKNWTLSDLKNRIWSHVSSGQPIPGCVCVTALRLELLNRDELPVGYHDT